MRTNWFLDRTGKHCPKRADGENGPEAELGFKIFFLSFCLCWLFVSAFSSYSKRGLLSRCGARAAHGTGLFHCRAQALGARSSVVVARGL